MKTTPRSFFLVALFLVTGLQSARSQSPLGTAFTYQGRLSNGTAPATGLYDFQFSLWNGDAAGTQVGATLTKSAVPVANGVFSISLDFGADAFSGDARWLELAVRANGESIFAALPPRRALTPSPHALYASTAGTAATAASANAVAAANITGTIAASQLASGAAAANLAAGGLCAVPSGGMLLSTNARDSNLTAAGYAKLGRVFLDDCWESGTTGALSTRSGHSTIWTGTELIVWGGYNGSSFLSDGARFNPETSTWSGVSSTGAPAARNGHSAVWTGTEMIIWGGQYSSGVFGSGAGYNPATDSWRTLSTSGAPGARVGHSAFWTGGKMLIWGGTDQNGNATYGDGACYNPTTDSWTAITSSGAPSGRRLHLSVWTGTEMIIWGGWNGSSYLNSGARYNPATDGWTPVAASGAPSARGVIPAVWTGTEMIVWSGWNSGYFSDGGHYNPTSDTWSGLNTAGAPSPRAAYSAVWTGTEMIVWGGGNNGSSVGSGGRYSPATDTWAPVTNNGSPAPRRDHTATWTGTEMLIFGGFTDNGGKTFNDIWSYTPGKTAYLYVRP